MNRKVYLLPMTAEMYHAYFKEYQNDLDLYADKSVYTPYIYEEENVNRYIQRQIDLKRKVFAIMDGQEIVGELVIKNIEPGKCATMGLAMKNAQYKDRGFGTKAEMLAVVYVFQELNIPVLYADALLSNTRSQHVLEKVGFRLIKEEGNFRYYCMERPGKMRETGTLFTKEEYLRNPCRAASIPYWKAASMAVPENMKILHGDDFCAEMLVQYVDEPYFRLRHDLRVEPAAVPRGYSLCRGTAEEFAAHIHRCYGNGMTAAEVRGFAERGVYCPELWIALRDNKTGQIVATGIGEWDREMGEGILEWIQVSADYRGRGLGSFLVKELLWRMQGKAEFATVSGQCNNPTNPEALYRKCGFTGNDVWHVMRKRAADG